MLKSPPLVATLSDSMRMSPCSWGDIFTWPLRGDRIIGLRPMYFHHLDSGGAKCDTALPTFILIRATSPAFIVPERKPICSFHEQSLSLFTHFPFRVPVLPGVFSCCTGCATQHATPERQAPRGRSRKSPPNQ